MMFIVQAPLMTIAIYNRNVFIVQAWTNIICFPFEVKFIFHGRCIVSTKLKFWTLVLSLRHVSKARQVVSMSN